MATITQPRTQTDTPAQVSSGSGLDATLRVVAYAVLVFVALLMFVPFAFSVATSLKTNQEAIRLSFSNMFWPSNPTFDAYRVAFEANVARWFFNSALVAAIWILGRALFDTMAGYAFARMQFPGRNLVFLLVISTMMIPGIVTIIPKFILLQEFGLLNTYGALTLPFLADAFGIFLMKQFFESIPVELEEAARIDGASRYRMFAQIILPNAMPAVTALAIFSFQGSWNAFLEPLIFISGSSPNLFTLPVGLANFRQAYYTEWPTLMAMSVITTVPLAVFFLIFQRYFVESSASSGIKG
ncbi:MAG: carbohydrate ABC transporter permease [Chloroflexia bacterium]|nr:carbohydrate ABC transporter permease [Chloroflexia bacterium]